MALSYRQLNAITSLSSAGSLFRAPPTRTRCSDGTSAGRVTGRYWPTGRVRLTQHRRLERRRRTQPPTAPQGHPPWRAHHRPPRIRPGGPIVRVPARRGAPAPETSCPPATTEHPGPDAGSNRASSSRGLTWPERKRSPVRPGPWRFSGGTLARAWSMCWPQPVQVILVQRLQTAGLHMGRSSPGAPRGPGWPGPAGGFLPPVRLRLLAGAASASARSHLAAAAAATARRRARSGWHA